MTGGKTGIAKKTKKESGYIGTFVLSRYYSPEPNQLEYFLGSYPNENRMNCGGDCRYTANGHELQKSEAGYVGACPQKYLGKRIKIDMGFGKQDFYCADVGSAIKGLRLDIRSGYGSEGYNNIKNGVVRNTGKAKVFIF